ncbi:MAG: capsule biosynthesis protein [Gaiellaceae bacterium]
MKRPFLLQRRRWRSVPSPWPAIVASPQPPRLAEDGPRVLSATSVGGHPVAPIVDSLVAMALWLRGAEPQFLLCDAALPGCEQAQYVAFNRPEDFVRAGPRPLCQQCLGHGLAWLKPFPFPLHRYREFVSAAERARLLRSTQRWDLDRCFTFVEDRLHLGEQARAGTIRFFGKADLSSEPEATVLGVARRYAAGALVSAAVASRALERFEPDVVVAHHGVYVPQGVLGEVARQAGVRVVNWGTSYRDRTVIYSHEDTYHRTLLAEPDELWNIPLDAHQEKALMTFLAERRQGRGDWQWVTPEAALRREEQEQHHLIERLGLDPDKPTIGLLTNVLWDAQLYYEGHAFADMLEWLWFTIDFFARRRDLQLVIRIHPHEVKQGNRQPVGAELMRRYPKLPPNIHVVAYDDPANTYALMDLCSVVLIYGTKTGVELAPFGKPVIVAADAWIRGKGLTRDVTTSDEYARVLQDVEQITPLDSETMERARRYAYYFFFRRMIPLESLEPDKPELKIAVRSMADLLPGRDPGLDVICRGILEGTEFVVDG